MQVEAAWWRARLRDDGGGGWLGGCRQEEAGHEGLGAHAAVGAKSSGESNWQAEAGGGEQRAAGADKGEKVAAGGERVAADGGWAEGGKAGPAPRISGPSRRRPPRLHDHPPVMSPLPAPSVQAGPSPVWVAPPPDPHTAALCRRSHRARPPPPRCKARPARAAGRRSEHPPARERPGQRCCRPGRRRPPWPAQAPAAAACIAAGDP